MPYVIFDAVGTLIVPKPSAAEIYCRVAEQHNINREESRVRQRIRASIRKHEADAAREQTTSEIEKAFWRAVVTESLELPVEIAEPVFEALWSKFQEPPVWRFLPGVAESLERIHRKGISLAIASNFDGRLKTLWRQLFGSETLASIPIFCCDEIGWRKPHPNFYVAVQEQLAPGPKIMVGDTFDADVLGPAHAGWDAIWLTNGDTQPDTPLPASARAARDLAEAADIILECWP